MDQATRSTDASSPAAALPVDDETMRRLLGATAPCHAFLLRRGPAWDDPASAPLQWEHARHMFTLLRDGRLRLVCALPDGTEVVGVGLIEAPSRAEAEALLRDDPGVRGGRITWEVFTGVVFAAGQVAF